MAHLHQRRHLRITNQLRFRYFELSASSFLAVSCMLSGCARHEPATASVPQPLPADQTTTKPAPKSSPTLAEVNEAIARVFKDAAIIDSKHEPNFLAGDFNGDASQDIAVIVQPVNGKLAEMNQEFPPWILRDALRNATRAAPPPRVVANEILLAIIHGYGPNGWRDKDATQTYLLKNAVGLEVTAYEKASFVSAAQGAKLPRLVGDLIGEKLGGKSVYLYFSGAEYSWYDPKTFKAQPEPRLTHPGMTAKKKIDLLHPNLVAAEK
jgi:hypothetical protein